MNQRKLLLGTLGVSAAAFCIAAATGYAGEPAERKTQRMEEKMRAIPDSAFEDVKAEDLLNDEVYLKLARDGWTPREIMTIMETAVKDKKKAKEKFGYGYYAKQWRPAYGRSLGDDPLYQFVDSGLPEKMIASVIDAVGEYDYNTTWPVEAYDSQARKRSDYVRKPGYFRQVRFNPSSGRMHWVVANQKDSTGRQLYAIPDNAGIFRSDDGGESWSCITDNIPDRANRSHSPGYSLPVDPDDWNHLFAFMANSTVYETTDGGKSWRRIAGATHKNFKRGYCFRDSEGTLRFIGAQPNGDSGRLWISQDTCRNWTEIKVAPEFIETGNKSFWFQQVAFSPENRDLIYFPGSRSILYMDDGGRGTESGGTRSYTLKRMKFNLTGTDNGGRERHLTDLNEFPFDGTSPGFLEINPMNGDMMYFAIANRSGTRSALYVTENGGKTWETLQEMMSKDEKLKNNNFGSGCVFGNEAPWNWLGGFGVEYNPENPRERPRNIFGCSMSSAYSIDGGRNFTEYAWGYRQKSLITQGLKNPSGQTSPEGYYYVTASRHNADNHCIFSHRSGKVFRGGDGGFFVHDPTLSGDGKAVPFADWVNISSDLGQMLFYNVRCNEFGDQAIIGNTQDIDVQTYRYGRWGHWRGYEGCESSFNPYTSTGYMSGGGGGYAPEGMNPDSWHTARNYADVVTGAWFMLRTWNGDNTRSTLYRVDDVGRSLTDLYGAIGARVTNLSLARDKGRLTVFAKTADNVIRMSTDSCRSFKALVAYNGNLAAFSGSSIAGDPDDSNVIYIGQNGGKVWRYTVDDGRWTAVGSGLPANINCTRLLFHEGSGDLYYCDTNTGIYVLRKGEAQWRFWTRGYNNAKFNDVDINYTTQEMVISDYGRGVWVADLETPADRYFRDGFGLREVSHRDGIRTFGIDTEWTIPLYYSYRWYVNGEEMKNPYRYLMVKDTEEIRSLQLRLTLREAPDVSTLSAEFNPGAVTPSAPIGRHQGNALYSTGAGRVDLGYMDWFHDDFSVDLWVNPASDGVILSNSQLTVEKGAKGWVLYIENGILKFKYYPSNVLQQPTYEVAMEQNPVVTGSAIPRNRWSHVAVTQERHGDITLYINGEPVGYDVRKRESEEHSLNNSVILSLFGDSFELSPIEASVDEVKVWKKALSRDEVRREMFSTNLTGSTDLAAHYDFNGETLGENRETFTGHAAASRTRAVTEARRMSVPVSADFVAEADLVEGANALRAVNGGLPVVDIKAPAKLAGVRAVAYAYEGNRWENPDDNLSEAYYDPSPYGYMIRTFGSVASDARADVTFHNGNGSFRQGVDYRLYMADNADDRMYWKRYPGKVVYDGGALTLPDATLADITDRKLLLVTMKPAIEMEISGLSPDGRIVLYDDGHDRTRYDFTARLIADKQLKENRYEIMSDSAVLVLPEAPLSFDDRREAHGTLEVDTDLVGDFGNTISTFIRGRNDEDMIPIPVDILNRITPKTLGNPVEISNGCLRVGSAADFAALKGSNHFTMMGWVRVDSEKAITSGRNGDGVAPLIFFRNASGSASATGIHLRNGTLGYHWNDQGWNYNASTPFTITKEDLGKWVHVALVVRPEGAWMYFNGMEHQMTGTPATMPLCVAESPLLLGTNTQGNYTYFSGAFDHVALWSRSLGKEEIRRYMHSRVLLNDPGLMAYITFDETDGAGHYRESLDGFTSNNHYGSVHTGAPTPVPFNPFRQDIRMTDPECPILLSGGTSGSVSTFEGAPYNYIAAGTDEQRYLPLNTYYYTLVFDSKPSATGELTLTYSFEGLVDGETIAIGIRDLGSTAPFADYITAGSVSGGKATFRVPASRLAGSSEIMFFSTPESSHRPTIVRMALKDSSAAAGGVWLVADSHNTIDVDVTVVSGTDEVRIVPVESYVSVSSDVVNMSDPSQTVTLTVNTGELRKSNRFGLSDVTLNLQGTTAEPLTLKVGLRPVVSLSLRNGTDATHFEATAPVATMDIEAELIEGYLDGDVPLKFTPESIGSAFSTGVGSLLLERDVEIAGLRAAPSADDGYSQGWNLLGNPFLMEINLTKPQNYAHDPGAITRYVYHTEEGSGNVFAYDMTEYDGRERILPFQSYYVQAMKDGSSLTVSATARERGISRKTFDYYTANEVQAVTLSLLDGEGREIDRTTVRWEEDAQEAYLLGEDAAKVRSAGASDDEMYTLTSDDRAASVNVTKSNISENAIPVVIDVRAGGVKKIAVSRLNGFSGSDDSDHLYLEDARNGTKTRTLLNAGDEYEFDAEAGATPLKGFYLVPIFREDVSTGAEAAKAGRPDYRVYTDYGQIRVTGLQGDASVGIYALSGLPVAGANTREPEFIAAVEGGVYIVRIIENGREFVSKVIVK